MGCGVALGVEILEGSGLKGLGCSRCLIQWP